MRKFISSITCCLLFITSYSQSGYWQQQVNYTIDVSLDDKARSLDGFERIEYINRSPDTLDFIWFHVWPNAYKNDKTAFTDQLLENGQTKFYFSGKEEKGYINRLDFKVNNITAAIEDHPQHIDIIKLVLPSPLAPEQTAIITTPFHVKLPYNFSRSGYDGESFQATQWYPKPAVYDSKGWHPMPYLDQGEFYSEFGNFDVTVTVPSNYVVAATGDLQNEEERTWLNTRKDFEWIPTSRKVKTKGGGVKTITQDFPPSTTTKKSLRFRQEQVHDFAWFADKRFAVQQDTCRLPSGKIVTTALYYYKKGPKSTWSSSMPTIKETIHFYSAMVGEYPYNVVSVVQGPWSFGGGMEYPTITVISPVKDPDGVRAVITHEIGHNWFYGILGSNERTYPWMDEGLNTFYENKFHHRNKPATGSLNRTLFETSSIKKRDQPINTSSEKFSEYNYNLTAYYKAAEWMRYLESVAGTAAFQKGMQEYYRRWQFKHPQPEDFKKAMQDATGKNLDSVFALLEKKGVLPNQQRSGTRVAFLINPAFYDSYHQRAYKNTLLAGPAFGFNSYDKLMAGVLLTNLKLPPSRLQFLVAPMFATGSKTFAGIGFVNYSVYPDGIFQQVDIGVSAAMFSGNEFKKQDGEKEYFGFRKLVPGIRLTLNEKNARSTANTYLQWKSYLFREESYRISYDSIFNPPDTTIMQVVNTLPENRTLNQFRIVTENFRKLYPYRGELKVEQGKDFVRAAFTGNYFFNYGEKGGLSVRLFAGKFFYSGSKTFTKRFATDRYHLNLTGANGYEDYTYSDYFIGRNKFEGLASQQIMVRDGAFKIRTDLLSDKIGRTDDWLAAINFSTTIPDRINPLALLPVKIPLKVFVDIGTVAEAWDRNANEDRFLFDAGLQIPILQETINIYIPLLYSRVFKDYVQSYLPEKKRFFRTISFSIDISNFNLRKLDRHLF